MIVAPRQLLFLVDTSLSIGQYIQDYTNTINDIIRAYTTIRNSSSSSSSDLSMTLATFNDDLHYLCKDKILQPNSVLVPAAFFPTGLTAFYDNLNQACTNYQKEHKNADSPLVIILTDGEDTTSKVVSESFLSARITALTRSGWNFIFLGTTKHSMSIGRQLGFQVCILYTPTRSCFAEIGNVITKLLSAASTPLVQADIDMRQFSMDFKSLKL